MFREMRRFKQQVSQDECKKILKDEKRAAFSVIGDEGYPYTIPINFYYEEADHTIYFHGAREGHKMDAIQKCNKVCLTTWNQGFKKRTLGMECHKCCCVWKSRTCHRYQDYRRPSSKTGRKILPYSRRSRKRNEWFCKKPCPAICNQN